MRTLRSLTSVMLVCLFPAIAFSQQAGDKIVVISANAPLRSKDATTGSVSKGEILVVKNMNGKWLWVISTDDKTRTVKGWIDRSDVISFSQALDFFNEEVRRNPSATAYNNRGMFRSQKGDYDVALGDFNEAIRLDPYQSKIYNARGKTWCLKREYDKALVDLNEAIRLDPASSQAYCNRGSAWLGKTEYDKAIADLNEAMRLNPKDAMIYNNRGSAWNEKKEYGKALSDCNLAIQLDPKLPPAYNNRGVAWDGEGNYAKAIADFNEAIQLDPKNEWPWNNRAWLAATCPDAKYRDGRKAISDATKACVLTSWNDGEILGTLAAAYAEAGDFVAAVKWQSKWAATFSERKKKEWGHLLGLYKAHKPYRGELKK
jgi:tetratricopeptide (TPR) repeat protein